MNKFKKHQILMLSLLAALLFITPLLSSSLRTTYIYFIINLLIIALGAEAGLISVFSKPSDDKKRAVPATSKPVSTTDSEASKPVVTKVIEKCVSEKIVGAVNVEKVEKCPSMPSLFFIGGGGGDQIKPEPYEEQEDEVEGEGLSGQELYTKAETFIGNFYKQLKMQREDSWKKIHGFYQKAF